MSRQQVNLDRQLAAVRSQWILRDGALALARTALAVVPVCLADGSQLFVSPAGSGTGCSQGQPCGLAEALAQAQDGDEVILTGGLYTGSGPEVLDISHSLSILGGWDGSSTRR